MRNSRVKGLSLPTSLEGFLNQIKTIFLAHKSPVDIVSKDKYGLSEDVYYLMSIWILLRKEYGDKIAPELRDILDRILYFGLLYLTGRKIDDYRLDIAQIVFEKAMRGEIWVKGGLEIGSATFFLLNLFNLYHRIEQRNPKPFSEVFHTEKEVPDMFKGS